MDVKCSNFLLVCFHISPQLVRLIPKQFWTYWGINLCCLVIVELQKKLLTKSCSMLSILTLTDIFVLKEEWCDQKNCIIWIIMNISRTFLSHHLESCKFSVRFSISLSMPMPYCLLVTNQFYLFYKEEFFDKSYSNLLVFG